MNIHIIPFLSLFLTSCAYPTPRNEHFIYNLDQSADADWLIVGAGAAGIATVGVMLDIGIDPQRILWIDPEFNVGRLGLYYNHVPGNSNMKTFVAFLNACETFSNITSPAIEHLKQLDPEDRHQELSVIIEPLRDITKYLRTKVPTVQDRFISLNFTDNVWYIGTEKGSVFSAHHVILATGSHPKTLPYQTNHIIPLDYALDRATLATLVTPDDIVGVVGSAHSAILLLKFLSELNVKHIYNFYKTPITYAVDMGTWTLNPFTGIKGIAAEWAQNVLEKNPPANLTRILSDDDVLKKMLPECTKVIYAIGYERDSLPAINNTTPITTYNETNGFIAPRLFGIGLAFPIFEPDHFGNPGYCIGLDCFMEYAQQLIPQWANDDQFKQMRQSHYRAQLNKLKLLSELFAIYTL